MVIYSNVGCFSTYSTFAGGNSFFNPSNVSKAIIFPPWRIAILSSSCSASSKYWVVKNTVVPEAVNSFTIFQTYKRASGSRPVVGSSRNIIFGFPTKLIAISILLFIPPE